MVTKKASLWAGVALVVVGLLALVHNLWPWWFNETFLWAVAITVVAAGLFVTYRQRGQSVFLLFGWGFLGLAGTLFLNAYGHPLSEISGALFVLGWALGFMALHLRQPDRWWTALVGGTLFVIAVLVALAELDLLYTYQRRFVLFFGMALVFGYIYLGAETSRNRWAGVLAGLSLLLAVLALLIHWAPDLPDYALPAILIAVGIWLTVRGLRESRGERRNVQADDSTQQQPD